MDENEGASLDVEFKRYLQIMRPYLEQLLDQDVIEICKAWIQRLSNCNDKEKNLRNKYVFSLCYQLAKGVLDEPFLNSPPATELPPLSDELDSDSSSNEIEYFVINSEEDTKVLFNNKKLPQLSDTDYHSQDNDTESQKNESNSFEKQFQSNKQTFYCYTCPEMPRGFEIQNQSCDEYKFRAKNLIMKLREIKTQNIQLHKELEVLRQECKIKSCENLDESIIKVDHCTSVCCHSKDSSTTLTSLKTKLQELQDSRNVLIQTIEHLQEKLDNYDDMKKHELEEIEAHHKLDIIKTKTATREETKEIYEKKIEEVKAEYEMMIENIRSKLDSEKQEIILAKNRVISEKEKIIEDKDNEIIRLRNLNDDQKGHLHEVINKFLEKPNDDTPSDNMRLKAEQLEKRLNKIEKTKTKNARVYEAKLAHLQREKHLAECSLQLQLVRQRAQVVSEVADENQTELTAALNKLENKYKEIVGNMQATAIQRRVQDQMAIESILHAACGIRNEGYTNSQGTNRSQFSGKTMQNQNRNGNQMNQSYDSEISALLNGNKVENLIGGNKSLGEDTVLAGYCLDGERMGELFERVYIPQKDIGDGPLKK
ncbi:uncharacterized protein LOC114354457 [Ostrinia furnacalis]|uniref:uncharacterized protein LOC114354457 n=1 Tax=Ostrinia furnacalis TaxID=93504 RepID=UPI00103EF487|nr:uncharacterized protein LOC114354457 [Ostrinia furnacalis]